LPVENDDDDTELVPDKPDATKSNNRYTISWHDYQNTKYKGSFGIAKQFFNTSYQNRNNLVNVASLNEVYNKCYKVDKQLIPSLVHMFDSIKKSRQLNTIAFAEMVGTFVQRIPYVLVHEKSCETLVRQFPNDAFLQQYHREGKQCLQNCRFGLQAPTEFGYNLKGDCDTRALLAFTILDKFGYQVSILTSEVYGHAILGIGLPYQGLYKQFQGIRYYVWELTAKDWKPGMLAPGISMMNNWNISITNQ
jgi:hypothetical protein